MSGTPPNTIKQDLPPNNFVYIEVRDNSQIDYVFGFLDSNIGAALTADNSIDIEDKVI